MLDGLGRDRDPDAEPPGIAELREIAERTIKSHRAQVMQRMGVHSLAELVGIADALAAGSSAQLLFRIKNGSAGRRMLAA
jgi:hypothetical protein